MKIIKINDNLKINIEMIYSLEKNSNQTDIDEWEASYKYYLREFSKEPPLLPITEDEVFQPIYGETVDKTKLKLYADALSNHIVSIVGEKPEYIETYFIILVTGLKVNIDKEIYDKIDNYLEKYIDKEI